MTVASTHVLRFPVERMKVAEFARALRDGSDRVPPTFTVVASHYAPEGLSTNEQIIALASLDPARVVLGSARWEFRRELVIGDELMSSIEYLGTDEREGRVGGRLRLARGRTTWTDSRGEIVVVVGTTLIETDQGTSRTGAESAGPDRVSPTDESVLELSVTDIVRYAGASGDFNPMHHDAEVARQRGYAGVFAMGMLPGGILASSLAARARPTRITDLEMRFRGIVWPGVAYRVESTDSTTALGQRLLAGDGRELLSVIAKLGPAGSHEDPPGESGEEHP